MKRDYFVDFQKNTITVSRSFFEEAARDTESAAYQKMMELRALGMSRTGCRYSETTSASS